MDYLFLHETTVDTYLPCATDGSVENKNAVVVVHFTPPVDSLFSEIVLSRRTLMEKSRGIHKAATRRNGRHI